MSTPELLARRVDYRRLATQNGRVAGTIELARLPRIRAEMADDARDRSPIRVDFRFFEDAQRRVRLEGEVDTTVRLRCQRCLRPFDHPMVVAVAGIVVADDDAAANVPREDEPVLADGDVLDVHATVVDEVLLALPAVARCTRSDCVARFADNSVPESVPTTETESRTHNPFAVLKQLKRDD